MHADFWHQMWNDSNIGFHQPAVNDWLVKHWAQVVAGVSRVTPAVSDPMTVLVPLCGKSLDLLWLHGQGHAVLGVELSEKAVYDFFTENQLPFHCEADGVFQRYQGVEHAQGLTLLAGDFFSLTREHTAHCSALYDRAALIALPVELRQRYAQHLCDLINKHSHGLLMSIEYDQIPVHRPPFSVSDEEVRRLFGDDFDIQVLEHYNGPDQHGNLSRRGIETLDERAYLLTGKDRTSTG